ncbi:hypothetical protein DRP04_10505 [Archaeoglobales archaeon]|mgnify:CR=1 FL=1|nr:MAG: hypothetical protein DRP04_10505 [Archaeoglobales archaeon]
MLALLPQDILGIEGMRATSFSPQREGEHRCNSGQDKNQNWRCIRVKIIVLSDPNSGISHRDEVLIAGFRFGIDYIFLNGQPIYGYSDYGSDIRYCVGRLMVHIIAESFRTGVAEQLKKIAEVLGERVDERYLFGNTYMGHPPKRVLIVSGSDACRVRSRNSCSGRSSIRLGCTT